MKCSLCGCEDLVEVEFPQEAQLIEVAVGIAGESSFYDIKNNTYCNSYICVNCGHFEFFNIELAKRIMLDRKMKESAKLNINKLQHEIVELYNKVSNIKKHIKKLQNESSDLDITVRRSNEIQTTLSNYKNEIRILNKTISEKKEEITRLEKTLK